MASPSGSQPASDGLAAALPAVLEPVLGPGLRIEGLQRLTGGASRETWAFTAGGEELILRRDPPGRPGAHGAMRREADVMQACRRAGLLAPEVLVYDDGGLLGTPALVMRRVPGETIARRILRDEEFAEARRVLVRQLGEFLAGLHSIDPAEVPGAEATDPIGPVWQKYERIDDRSATFEKAHRWIVENERPRSATALIHGDLRLGNVIVGPEGLRAVIDWELVHRGDPLEDLAWLSLKAWRFGEPQEVAGLASIDELVSAYESAGGRPVDRDALHWWLVLKTLTWGIGCMLQAHVHLTGGVRSVDLAAVGRRAAEQEWDLIELLAPDAWRTAREAPARPPRADGSAPYGRPTALELLEAVQELLAEKVVNSDDRSLTYEARVAANILATVRRELTSPPLPEEADDWLALAHAVRARLEVNSPKHLTR